MTATDQPRKFWKRNPFALRGVGFFNNVSVMLRGAAFSVVIISASSPILSRLYSPSEFGAMAVGLSLVSVLIVFLSLRYEFAIPLLKEDAQVDRLTVSGLVLSCAVSTLLWGVLWWSWPRLSGLLPLPPDRTFSFYLYLCLLASGFFQVANYWAVKRTLFAKIGYAKILQAVVLGGLQIGFGILHWGANGLLLGYAVAQFAAAVPLLYFFCREGHAHRNLRFFISRHAHAETLGLLRTHKNFALYSTWASFLDVVGTNLPTLLMGAFFSSNVVGLFSLTFKVIGLPINLVTQSVGQAFYNEIVSLTPEKRARFTSRLGARLFILSAGAFGFLIPCGPDSFALAFGAQWYSAGVFAQLIAPSLVMVFVTAPLSMVCALAGRQKGVLFFSITLVVARALALWWFAGHGTPEMAVAALSLAGMAVCIFYLYWILRVAGSGLAEWFAMVRGFLFFLIVVCVSLMLVRNYLPTISYLLLSAGVFAALGAAYAPVLLKRGDG